MQIHVRGKPCFDDLAKWQREALVHPLLDVIKDFYSKEENRQAYEKWKLQKENELKNKIEIKTAI